MVKQNIETKKGFTIIEVVLVLAIAGLIFLMVFIALPALQRSQRDTQRRNDMARFLSQLQQYQSNNNGKVPNDKDAYEKFIEDYLKVGSDTFEDPSLGADYAIAKVVKCSNNDNCKATHADGSDLGNIYVFTNATCEGEATKYVKGDRKIAITLKLEGAGTYCGSNQSIYKKDAS